MLYPSAQVFSTMLHTYFIVSYDVYGLPIERETEKTEISFSEEFHFVTASEG